MVSKVESPFQILSENGFLPTEAPLDSLPSKYYELERILQEMPIELANGEPGLLAQGLLGNAIKFFPLLDVSHETNTKIVAALFRDYSFLASAYIFELLNLKKGLTRNVLPSNLAIPLNTLGLKLGIHPFLDYSHSYILYNWKKLDQNGGMEIENLKTIRSFTGSKSEEGFILVTVGVNQYSAPLIKSSLEFLKAVEKKDHVGCTNVMKNLLETMKLIYAQIGRMWTQSQHSDFKFFRPFINGTTDQRILPNGLLFDGINDEPRLYRGVSAATDSTIPLMDAILEMPGNALSKELRDFGSLRPILHQKFLECIEMKSKSLGTKDFGIETNPLLFLQILDQVFKFRIRHWRFIKMYILRHEGSGASGSGGSSLNLLPNVLTVVEEMQKIVSLITLKEFKLTMEEKSVFKKMAEETKKQLVDVALEMKVLAGNQEQ